MLIHVANKVQKDLSKAFWNNKSVFYDALNLGFGGICIRYSKQIRNKTHQYWCIYIPWYCSLTKTLLIFLVLQKQPQNAFYRWWMSKDWRSLTSKAIFRYKIFKFHWVVACIFVPTKHRRSLNRSYSLSLINKILAHGLGLTWNFLVW